MPSAWPRTSSARWSISSPSSGRVRPTKPSVLSPSSRRRAASRLTSTSCHPTVIRAGSNWLGFERITFSKLAGGENLLLRCRVFRKPVSLFPLLSCPPPRLIPHHPANGALEIDHARTIGGSEAALLRALALAGDRCERASCCDVQRLRGHRRHRVRHALGAPVLTSLRSSRRVGKGALVPCPPSLSKQDGFWWARFALPTLRYRASLTPRA